MNDVILGFLLGIVFMLPFLWIFNSLGYIQAMKKATKHLEDLQEEMRRLGLWNEQ